MIQHHSDVLGAVGFPTVSVSIFPSCLSIYPTCQVPVGQNTGLNEGLVDDWVVDIGLLGRRPSHNQVIPQRPNISMYAFLIDYDTKIKHN